MTMEAAAPFPSDETEANFVTRLLRYSVTQRLSFASTKTDTGLSMVDAETPEPLLVKLVCPRTRSALAPLARVAASSNMRTRSFSMSAIQSRPWESTWIPYGVLSGWRRCRVRWLSVRPVRRPLRPRLRWRGRWSWRSGGRGSGPCSKQTVFASKDRLRFRWVCSSRNHRPRRKPGVAKSAAPITRSAGWFVENWAPTGRAVTKSRAERSAGNLFIRG